MTLRWNGDQVVRRVERAAAAGTAETVDRAIAKARTNTPVDTGAARDSLEREGDGLSIAWGYHVPYGPFIEIGDRGRDGHHALRRAADEEYPGLPSRIREALV